MEKIKTDLTVTITGASVDEEGLLRVVNARYENVRALYVGALRMVDGEQKLAEAIVGTFPEDMWADLMLRMLDCAQIHGQDALEALQRAITAFLDMMEDKQ